jgi:hypothetical protein
MTVLEIDDLEPPHPEAHRPAHEPPSSSGPLCTMVSHIRWITPDRQVVGSG